MLAIECALNDPATARDRTASEAGDLPTDAPIGTPTTRVEMTFGAGNVLTTSRIGMPSDAVLIDHWQNPSAPQTYRTYDVLVWDRLVLQCAPPAAPGAFTHVVPSLNKDGRPDVVTHVAMRMQP
jgi:hypothetical protein